MKLKYLLIIVIFVYSCVCKVNERQKHLDLKSLFIQTIENEKIQEEENQFYLFIADDMCTACIEKEYLNIKNDSIAVVIIGLFNNKRHFMASTSSIQVKNKIFVDKSKQNIDSNSFQPTYFIYNKKTKTISDVFYPGTCEEGKTISYFQKVKNRI